MPGGKLYDCPKCPNMYSTAYSMYRHMRKVHNCDISRCVTLYCPIESCNQSYDRYNALDTHLTHVHYADIRKENLKFEALSDFETWLQDLTASTKTKFIKRSCNNSYRYYRCHRSGLPKTSTDKIGSMKSSVKIGRHCPSRIIAKITDGNVQVEFVPTHIGHDSELSKLPLNQKKRMDIACRLAGSSHNSMSSSKEDIDHSLQQQLSILNSSANQQQQRTQMGSGSHTNNSPLLQSANNARLILSMAHHSSVEQNLLSQNVNHQSNSHSLNVGHSIHHQTIIPTLVMNSLSPSKADLTARFNQLLNSLRSDKHASIVKAQLEVCFALIKD